MELQSTEAGGIPAAPVAVPVTVIPFIIGEYHLREFRMRTRKLKVGEAIQSTIAVLGDSYTQNNGRYIKALCDSLNAEFGVGSAGWCGFGSYLPTSGFNSSVDGSRIDGSTRTGTWSAATYYTSTSPDLAQVSSSTVGSNIQCTGEAGMTGVDLFHIAGTAGQIRYRWDGGGWTALNVGTGSGLTVTALAGVPATAWTLDLEVVSGTVKLCGLNGKTSTANGVTVHKLGCSGGRAQQFAAVNAAEWQTGLAALAPNTVIMFLGVNDQNLNRTPAQYSADMQTMITRAKTAVPTADILLVAAPANGLSHTYPMSDYTTVLYDLAVLNFTAFIDMQYVFGESYSEYGYGSTRNWFLSDNIHPDGTTGGRALADGLVRVLTK